MLIIDPAVTGLARPTAARAALAPALTALLTPPTSPVRFHVHIQVVFVLNLSPSCQVEGQLRRRLPVDSLPHDALGRYNDTSGNHT